MKSAIIIISYNSAAFLEDNLTSVTGQSLPFDEILVVDNRSTDGSRALVRKFGTVVLAALPSNLGYGGAANTGLDMTRSDLVTVANPDIRLSPDFNKKLIAAFNRQPALDMAAPLLLRFDGETVDSAGQEPSLSLYPRERGYGKPRSMVDISPKDIFSVCGALTVFRRTSLERLKTGGEYYDRDFFMFWEDFDIGWRAQLLGMTVRLLDGVVAYHHRSGGLQRTFLSRLGLALDRPAYLKYHLVKNRYLTLIKNFRLKQNWYSLPFVVLKDLFWTTTLTLFSPKIIIKLVRDRRAFRRALAKRRIIKQHE